MSNERIAVGFAVLAIVALVTSIMLVRMEQADRANGRPRPRIKTDIPRSVRDAFGEAAPDAAE